MGVLSFFKKKVPPIRLSVDTVPEWLESYLESKGVQRMFSGFRKEADEVLKGIQTNLEQLKHAELRNKVAPRIKNVMEGNRKQYIQRIEQFISGVSLPASAREIDGFAKDFSEKLEQLAVDTRKNFFVLKEFFESEVVQINQKLREVDRKASDLRAQLEKLGFEEIAGVESHFSAYKEALVKIERLEKGLADEKKKKEVPAERLAKVEKRLKELHSSKDLEAMQTLESQIKAFEKSKEVHERALKDGFSKVSKALKKHAHSSGRQKLIEEYMKHPLTLLEDDTLVIVDVLQEMEGRLEEIGIKNVEEVRGHLAAMTKEWFLDKKEKIKEVMVKIEGASDRLRKSTTRMLIAEQKRYKKIVEEDLAEVEKSIAMIAGELERISPRLLLQKVRDSLLLLDENIVLEELE